MINRPAMQRKPCYERRSVALRVAHEACCRGLVGHRKDGGRRCGFHRMGNDPRGGEVAAMIYQADGVVQRSTNHLGRDGLLGKANRAVTSQAGQFARIRRVNDAHIAEKLVARSDGTTDTAEPNE